MSIPSGGIVVPPKHSLVDVLGNRRERLVEGVYVMTDDDKDVEVGRLTRRLSEVRRELDRARQERDTLAEQLKQVGITPQYMIYRDSQIGYPKEGGVLEPVQWPPMDDITAVPQSF